MEPEICSSHFSLTILQLKIKVHENLNNPLVVEKYRSMIKEIAEYSGPDHYGEDVVVELPFC